MTETPAPKPIQSVDRALAVLEILAGGGEMGISEIARELEVHRSTVFRLLATLEGRGLVEQVEHRGSYRIGLGILRLAGGASANLDIVQEATDACRIVAETVNETANAAILDADAAVNIAQAAGGHQVAIARQYVGQRSPINATSTGKILLAHAESTVRNRILTQPLESYTPATITDPEVLRAELSTVRKRGWATSLGEFELDTTAISVPIRGINGKVLAALSATAPSFRFTSERLAEVTPELERIALDLSHRLGYAG